MIICRNITERVYSRCCELKSDTKYILKRRNKRSSLWRFPWNIKKYRHLQAERQPPKLLDFFFLCHEAIVKAIYVNECISKIVPGISETIWMYWRTWKQWVGHWQRGPAMSKRIVSRISFVVRLSGLWHFQPCWTSSSNPVYLSSKWSLWHTASIAIRVGVLFLLYDLLFRSLIKHHVRRGPLSFFNNGDLKLPQDRWFKIPDDCIEFYLLPAAFIIIP